MTTVELFTTATDYEDRLALGRCPSCAGREHIACLPSCNCPRPDCCDRRPAP